MFISWNDSCKIGIPSVDADHKAIADLVNDFMFRVGKGAPLQELHDTLSALIAETDAHFHREETLLDKHDYPMLAIHASDHERLILQMRHFQEPYERGTATPEVNDETVQFLYHWLLDHIQHEDRPYKPFIMKFS